ncbi:hypothetical protein PilKf_00444 [Pillotina sp. SPG140]
MHIIGRRYSHTPSAKRKLKRTADNEKREKRYMTDCNHCITNAANIDVQTYVLEDLTGIRTQKNKGKKFNSWLSNWSCAQFEQQLKYKCELHAIHVVQVDPRYTSQQCNRCGTIDKSSRNKSRYICVHCGHSRCECCKEYPRQVCPVKAIGTGLPVNWRSDNHRCSRCSYVQSTELVPVVVEGVF